MVNLINRFSEEMCETRLVVGKILNISTNYKSINEMENPNELKVTRYKEYADKKI